LGKKLLLLARFGKGLKYKVPWNTKRHLLKREKNWNGKFSQGGRESR